MLDLEFNSTSNDDTFNAGHHAKRGSPKLGKFGPIQLVLKDDTKLKKKNVLKVRIESIDSYNHLIY